ncbi:Uma2 family endonuclease [Streptomyces verrucosisporus]|uniref:Uma2 family endonuclease n=1 Tax=Streptomyces verrucosisporus TaxID=1695161 RepID=UPI0019D09D85|nr:Uma2 family endonuclease [Streptomyces verrucosisporus]MBN3928493.1 Uma2 family endonuclease [Streptomyces verrucosisporus]
MPPARFPGGRHGRRVPPRGAYAAAGVPARLIVDPYTARCHLFTRPREGEYSSHLTVDFGEAVDMTGTLADLVPHTRGFPRERASGRGDR